MKNLLVILAIASVIVSCNSSGAGDKKAELEKLKQQQKELADKISQLEKELVNQGTAAAPSERPELVSVQEVTLAPFTHYIELQGKLDAEENVTVTPQIPGAVNHIYVSVGQNVSKGQVLAEMDNGAMQKNVQTLQTQLTFANDLFNKQKALWEQKIGTEVQYLSAKNNVETLENQLAAAKEQLEMSKLKSPINGVVDAVDIKTGEISSPGLSGIRVVNFSNLKVKGEVSEAHSENVQVGDKVKIFFPDLHKEFDSKISYSARVINPQSRTFTVESKLSNQENLKPNMVTVLKIVDYEKQDAVVVGVNLVQKSGDGEFVYVAAEESGKKIAKRQPVTVGKIYGGHAEISSGLKPGDKLITQGYQDLVNGQAIQFN